MTWTHYKRILLTTIWNDLSVLCFVSAVMVFKFFLTYFSALGYRFPQVSVFSSDTSIFIIFSLSFHFDLEKTDNLIFIVLLQNSDLKTINPLCDKKKMEE